MHEEKDPLLSKADYMFLISEPLLSYLEIYTIESSYRSDHSVISMSLVFNDFKNGIGL